MRRIPTVQPVQQTIRTHEGVDAAHESKDEDERIKLFKIKVHIQIFAYMATVADIEVDEGDGMNDNNEGSRTELDSHTNMPVVGRHAYIVISDTGRMADVSPFTHSFESSMLPFSTTVRMMDNHTYTGYPEHALRSFNEEQLATTVRIASSRNKAK
jgi:hypothetical protein